MSYPDVRFAGGPTYQPLSGPPLLFPFTLSNGTLDLPSSFTNTSVPRNDGVFIRRLGGDTLVQSIGSNLRNYIKNTQWSDGTTTWVIPNASSIAVSMNGVVTRVQQLGTQNLPANVAAASYKVSTYIPTGFIQYGSSYLFDAPLIVSASAQPLGGGSTRTIYITFYTQWDH
jgi:hypothetical protein